jgi:hypothetical protein
MHNTVLFSQKEESNYVFAGKGLAVDATMLSEVSQSHINTSHVFSHIWSLGVGAGKEGHENKSRDVIGIRKGNRGTEYHQNTCYTCIGNIVMKPITLYTQCMLIK